MGKKGQFQCFTVDRNDSTIITRFGSNLNGYCLKDFYDIPSEFDQQSNLSNKQKFLKAQRFREIRRDGPAPDAYFPKNYTLKPKSDSVKKITSKIPILFYEHTTVPQKAMSFQTPSSSPAPGRYNPHDVICSCYLTNNNKKCPGKISGDGHSHVFDSTILRLVKPIKMDNIRARKSKNYFIDDNNVKLDYRQSFVPEMTFHKCKRSISAEGMSRSKSEREIRFNTIMTKKKSFSNKNNIAFLSATPRSVGHKSTSVKVIDKQKRTTPNDRQVNTKHLTKKRMDELATPKNPLSRVGTKEVLIPKPFVKQLNADSLEILLENTDELNMENNQCFVFVS